MDDARNEMEVVDPEAAKKKVSQASSSGGNFFPWIPTAENFDIFTLLILLYLNHCIRDVL